LKHRFFLKNKIALAVMYDAVFFVILVSLSGVVLLPALQSDIAMEGSIDKHREHVADEALNTYLVSRADKFSYSVAGDLIDDVAGSIGIDNSSSGLYKSITSWLLAREQLHKTHANLVAENLACQIRLPVSVFGTNRFNIFTGDFDRQLKNETKEFFNSYLSDKYSFNFTAIWHPIKGVTFGGELQIGDTPPDTNCYVSKSFIMMPFKPTFNFNQTNFTFTRYWVEEEILKKTPYVGNITTIVNGYNAGIPPFDNKTNATKVANENLSNLIQGFLVDGITDRNNDLLFPGIVNLAVDYGFSSVSCVVNGFTDDLINGFMGEALGSVDSFFGDLGGSDNPIFNGITETINQHLSDFIGSSFASIDEGLNLLEEMIKEEVTKLVESVFPAYIQNFIDFVLSDVNIVDLYDFISTWLFDQISLNKAEVRLMVWEVRG
jgi:hypothetical protein